MSAEARARAAKLIKRDFCLQEAADKAFFLFYLNVVSCWAVFDGDPGRDYGEHTPRRRRRVTSARVKHETRERVRS